MHWNNGRFHGPVTLEDKLFITDYKYNAINYDNDNKSINYGDNKIKTTINDKNCVIGTVMNLLRFVDNNNVNK